MIYANIVNDKTYFIISGNVDVSIANKCIYYYYYYILFLAGKEYILKKCTSGDVLNLYNLCENQIIESYYSAWTTTPVRVMIIKRSTFINYIKHCKDPERNINEVANHFYRQILLPNNMTDYLVELSGFDAIQKRLLFNLFKYIYIYIYNVVVINIIKVILY